MTKKIKICHVVGARPNFIKIAPLIKAIKSYDRKITQVLIHTGQHYNRQMSDPFFKDLSIPKPDFNLKVGSHSHAEQTALIMIRLEPVLLRVRPDIVLVVGDVNSTLAAALTATKLRIPVAHVEAGLRSFDRDMPEEINRVLTDAVSDHLFIHSPEARVNLIHEGISPKKIHFVGNVMIDTLKTYLPDTKHRAILKSLNLLKAKTVIPYALLTLHRPENVDDKSKLLKIMDTLANIPGELTLVFPMHPRTKNNLGKMGLWARYKSQKRIITPDPLGYLDFMCLTRHARVVLTDSGGVQEETTALGIPCLTLRKNTERPVTVRTGTNRIVGINKKKILASIRNILSREQSRGKIPKYWDGHAARRTAAILSRIKITHT